MSAGRAMALYVNPGWDEHAYRTHRSTLNRKPAEFRRPAGSKPVKGGRWGVRRLAIVPDDGLAWSAYSRGLASVLSKRFASQQEAFAHARAMALLVANCEKNIIVSRAAIRKAFRRR